jgi:ABC-type bacteriocin/lantibiotic exporter with double-glycine peptidase domain
MIYKTLIKPRRKSLLFLMIASVVATVLEVYFIKSFSEALKKSPVEIENLEILVICLCIFTLIRILFNKFAPIISFQIGLSAVNEIIDVFIHSPNSDRKAYNKSEIKSLISVKTEKFSVLIFNVLSIISALAQIIVLLGYLFVVNIVLGLVVCLLLLGTGIILMFPIVKILDTNGRKINHGLTEIFRESNDFLMNWKYAVSLGTINETKTELNSVCQQTRYTQAYNQFITSIPKYVYDLVFYTAIIIALIVQANQNSNFVSVLFTYVFVLLRITPNFQILLNSFSIFRSTLPVLQEINKYLSTKRYPLKQRQINDDFTISNFSFSYDNKVIFDNFNLKINEGITQIIAPSGFGKSTLLECLAGIEEDYTGQIYLPTIKVVYLDQDGYLPPGPLSRVLRVNNTNTKIFEILFDLCELNEVAEDITALLNFRVNDECSNLSGGQKQRLLLVRGLLERPEVLILDEGLSGITVKHEEKILNYLYQLGIVKYIIFVSHRTYVSPINRVYL